MKHILWTTLLLLLCSSAARGQANKSVTLKGVIGDSLSAPMASATVVLLNATDSVIASFSITNMEGHFELRRVKPGDYVLQASYVGYQTYTRALTVGADQSEVDLGLIQIEPIAAALDQVLVKGDRIPMLINKDTIEYNAEAFKTQPNDMVEDLLRKLPGVEVESDGTVKAQGEEVQQILVDGKEFFGRDPQIATKNLPAEAVDKVQVFDKKSEMAEFTGIDDGQEEKAINLELKEDHKKGVFGNLAAGYGTEERYDTRINLNKFGKDQQISFIGMFNNVNKQGFSMNDYITFAGGLGNLMRQGGGGGAVRISSDNTGGVPIANGLSDGFVRTGASGINFNQDFGDKTELRASYFYSNIRNDILQEVRRENVLSERYFLSEENDDELSVNGNHRFNLVLEHEMDSSQNLRFNSTLAFNDSEYSILSNSQVLGETGLLQNQGLRDNQSEGNNMNWSSELLYRRNLGKKGRTLTAGANFGVSNDEQDAFLQSINQFAELNGTPARVDSILQDQFQTNDQIDYGLQLSYTEPLGKSRYLGFDYRRRNYSSELLKDVYDVVALDNILNTNLSNHYNRDYTFDRGAVSMRWVKSRSLTNLSMSLQHSNLTGELLIDEATIEKKYTNLLPRFSWNYDLSSSKRLRVQYSTSVREPSLTQLQPVVDNSNPLNIYIGNPDLRPEYSHRLQLRYMSFSQFSMTNLFATVNATFTDNAIVNARQIDEQFRQVTTPVNIDNDFRLSSFTGFGTPLKFVRSRLNLHANFSYNRGRVFVNDLEERTNRYTSSLNLSMDNQKKEVLDITFGGSYSHSLTNYSISDNLDQDFFNQRYYGDVTVTIADSWTVGTRLDYSIYSGGTFTDRRSVPIWQASMSKYLFKKKGQLELAAYDILNENIGIQQSIDLNYVEDIRVSSLAQYFFVRFTYAINQVGQSNALPGGAIHMIQRRGRG